MKLGAAIAALAAAAAVVAQPSPHPPFDLGGQPIWHPDVTTTQFAFLRSPVFVAPPDTTDAVLTITARPSPSQSRGTLQSKLFCSFKLFVNGVFVSAGPGHSVPQQSQAVVIVPIGAFLRPGTDNVLAIQAFSAGGTGIDSPRVQGILTASTFGGATVNLTATGPSWQVLDGTGYMNPTGDTDGSAWYWMPNEDLDRRVYPLGWDTPANTPSAAAGWTNASVQAAFGSPLYLEQAPSPVSTTRRACSVATTNSQLVCASAPEQETINLRCSLPGATGTPAVISSIVFASYGTPGGVCMAGPASAANNFSRNVTCDSANALAVLEGLCVGKAACSIAVGNTLLGPDPCDKTPKHLSIVVACSSTNAGPQTYVVDYGQQMMGGVNLTFWNGSASYAAGTRVTVQLGEELNPDGSVMVPGRQANDYNSTWTLAAGPADAGITHHEFIQFRYAQIIGSPVPITTDNALAWGMLHPAGGTGVSPWDLPCAAVTPNSVAFGNGAVAPASPVAAFASDNAGLDAVFNLTAYTAVATSLDINVDSQTRQRDLCHIDALITGMEQYAIFGGGDYALQRRTFLNAFGNDSGIWGSWYEFKASGALMLYEHAMETGDVSLAQSVWSTDDMSIVADGVNGTWYNSAQFYAGVRYFNGSGLGLLHFPPSGCGGSWACDPLADWPVQTRDGYDVNPDNSDDAIRNGIGQRAIWGLARVADLLGQPEAAARYNTMATAITAGMKAHLLRYNASEAYFVDGAVGNSTGHAAIHSTLYAVAAGAADNDTALAAMVTAYLVRRDIGVSSCMTGKWFLEALYRLGIQVPEAADFALELMSRSTFPSWGFMITLGATTTLEAWCPTCKWNTDWAHPWCAAPAFMIPRGLLGFRPIAPAWSRMSVAPQPSNVTIIRATVPTPLGTIPVVLSSLPGNVTLSFTVPAGSSAEVCLVEAGSATDIAARAARDGAADDVLLVNSVVVASVATGRMLCTVTDVLPGAAVVQRVPASVVSAA